MSFNRDSCHGGKHNSYSSNALRRDINDSFELSALLSDSYTSISHAFRDRVRLDIVWHRQHFEDNG